MPRDGSGVYSLPFPDVVTNTTIASSVENGFQHDIASDLNAPRPIVAGGTGANSAAAARTALAVETFGQVVTNYDSHVFLPGSFYSAGSATSPPVVGHTFVGSCAYVDASNMYLEAYDRDDAAQPGALWIRQKKAGIWSAWAKAQALNVVGTPAANQFTTWQSSTALQGVAITGLVKGNGAAAPTAAAAGTDYAPATSGTSILKGNGAGGFSNAVAGTDLVGPPANPTATIGLTAVNGSANTGMRSDAAPALSQSITPTWTGTHVFNGAAVFNAQATATTQTANDNSTKLATTAYVDNTVGALRGYLAGLTLSAAGGSASFGISAGMAINSTNAELMTLGSAYTKTTSAWTVGSGNGGLDTGAIATNTWYHVYQIKRPDTGVVDVCVSLSATNPTTGGAIPAAYTRFRRIGAMKTDGASQWTKFSQVGDDFLWDVPVSDYNINTPGTAAVLRTLAVPTGIQVWAWHSALCYHVAGTAMQWLYTSPDQADTAPSGTLFTHQSVGTTMSGASVLLTIRTNTSAQIRTRASLSAAQVIQTGMTSGWIDRRGKDA